MSHVGPLSCTVTNDIRAGHVARMEDQFFSSSGRSQLARSYISLSDARNSHLLFTCTSTPPPRRYPCSVTKLPLRPPPLSLQRRPLRRKGSRSCMQSTLEVESRRLSYICYKHFDLPVGINVRVMGDKVGGCCIKKLIQQPPALSRAFQKATVTSYRCASATAGLGYVWSVYLDGSSEFRSSTPAIS